MCSTECVTLDEALATIFTLRAEREQDRAERARDRAEIQRLVGMIERLTRQLDLLLAQRGEKPTKPEAPDPTEGSTDASSEPSAPPPKKKKERKPPRRHEHGPGLLPPDLERHTVEVPTPQRCPHCEAGGPLSVIETLVSEQYDHVRAYVRVRRTVRKVCLCTHCLRRVTPPQPPMPFDRAACTTEMMAWVLYAKCALHLPLDRLRRDFNRQGATISSPAITRWFARGAELLALIVAAMRLVLLTGEHLQFDGTGITVLDLDSSGRPAPRGQVLVFCSTEIAVFHYTASKEGAHIEDFLTRKEKIGEDENGKDITRAILWRGTATADALSAHDRLFKSGTLLEGGCNAHGFRKFRDDADKAPLLADTAMAFIGAFFAHEARAKADGVVGDALLAHRQAHCGPIAKDFHAWLAEHIEDLLPSNPVRKAMQYYINHWTALMRFLTDSRVPLDNNLSERLLRALAVGRKNWMFAGGEAGARAVCNVLSLIETAKLIGVDGYAYLVWALDRVVIHPDNRGLTAADLTPAAYKQSLQKAGAGEGFG